MIKRRELILGGLGFAASCILPNSGISRPIAINPENFHLYTSPSIGKDSKDHYFIDYGNFSLVGMHMPRDSFLNRPSGWAHVFPSKTGDFTTERVGNKKVPAVVDFVRRALNDDKSWSE